MAPMSAAASIEEQGTYETDDGLRQVMIVRYGRADYAVIDELVAPQGDDYDERFVESELLTVDEAEAVANDYLLNAVGARRPLVGRV